LSTSVRQKKLEPRDYTKSTENIFIKFDNYMDRWQPGDYARLFFLPMLKTLVAMATNSFKIWQI
jgi:hypothetical protein